MRRCHACKRSAHADEFLRFVLFEGELRLDLSRKLGLRGYNVCPTKECLKSFLKKMKRADEFEEVLKNSLESLRSYILNLLRLCGRAELAVIGQDNIKRERAKRGTLFLAKELSEKTKKRLERDGWLSLKSFTSEEIGKALFGNKKIGSVFVPSVGLGRKLEAEAKKLLELER